MKETVATLKMQINQEIENGNYEAADALTEELYRLQGLEQTDCEMPESFVFELKQKGRANKMMNIKKHIAKAAAIAAVIAVSGGTVYAGVQHFQKASHETYGLSSGSQVASDEVKKDQEPVIRPGDTKPEMSEDDTWTEVVSVEEGTADTAWLKKEVTKVTDKGYESDDRKTWTPRYSTSEVTRYTYQDYETACADVGAAGLFNQKFEQDGATTYEKWHPLDEDAAEAVNDTTMMTTNFKYGKGHFTLREDHDLGWKDGEQRQMMVITSAEKPVTNQREYTSKNGQTFALSDDTETGETRTTTVLTQGDYDAILTFTGLSEKEIHEILDTIR